MIVILTGIRWYLIVILICTSLMINDIEHHFIYLLAIFIYFGKISSLVFYPFFFFSWQGFTGAQEEVRTNSFPSYSLMGRRSGRERRERWACSLCRVWVGVCPGVRLEWWLMWFAQRSGGIECRGMLSTLLLFPRPWFYSWLLRSSNRGFLVFCIFCPEFALTVHACSYF